MKIIITLTAILLTTLSINAQAVQRLNNLETNGDSNSEVLTNEAIDMNVNNLENYGSESLAYEEFQDPNTNDNNYSGQNNGSSSKKYKINTFYAELGGYVLEIDDVEGTRGLVVAMQDQGEAHWDEAIDILSNVANHDFNGAKFKDWMLPDKRELDLIYNAYTNGNGANLNDHSYWSSEEKGSKKCFMLSFEDGRWITKKKRAQGWVRAVRKFAPSDSKAAFYHTGLALKGKNKTYNLHTYYPELGGYVIKVPNITSVGLVVAMEDLGSYKWQEVTNFLPYLKNVEAEVLKGYTYEFFNWRLPTEKELDLMYQVYRNGNGAKLRNTTYWSSSENVGTRTMAKSFVNGRKQLLFKDRPNDVRIVRNFGTKEPYKLNTYYSELGGYVIKLNPNGRHGLVMALNDQGESAWYGRETFFLSRKECKHGFSGAKYRRKGYGHEHGEWRLPTKEEIELICLYGVYNNDANLDGSGFYLTSTVKTKLDEKLDVGWRKPTSRLVWANLLSQDPDCKQGAFLDKGAEFFVRAVRDF